MPPLAGFGLDEESTSIGTSAGGSAGGGDIDCGVDGMCRYSEDTSHQPDVVVPLAVTCTGEHKSHSPRVSARPSGGNKVQMIWPSPVLRARHPRGSSPSSHCVLRESASAPAVLRAVVVLSCSKSYQSSCGVAPLSRSPGFFPLRIPRGATFSGVQRASRSVQICAVRSPFVRAAPPLDPLGLSTWTKPIQYSLLCSNFVSTVLVHTPPSSVDGLAPASLWRERDLGTIAESH
ncbi:hypothetical protein FB451DRAFT_1173158 [Mycena latifolia]|nr:hypothetical protein FB451DRAFT_1173158 [Mycena latifolia]